MPPSDPSLRIWWPTTQSLDLVEAPPEIAANAVRQEFVRIANCESVGMTRRRFETVGDVLDSETDFYNVPTKIIVLPTRSKWTVLWNNSFLCDGYDSLCWLLTSRHRLATIHWSSHDEWTTFQSGSLFHWRKHEGATLSERRVQAAQSDKRWDFFEFGAPLPEEDTSGYNARRKRDRLNERRLMELLSRLGADPWTESFYLLPGDVFSISRPTAPPMIRRGREQVLRS